MSTATATESPTGPINGLPLAQLGANPLKKNLFIEVDWMDDTQQCGLHSHRPTTAAMGRSFADSPVTNPDATTGIDLTIDYGQGGFTLGGTIVDDPIAPIGSIKAGVNGAEFAAIKTANFVPAREGYLHYAVHMHRYNTNSSSSGQAKLPGDDLIVSLQCFEGTNNPSRPNSGTDQRRRRPIRFNATDEARAGNATNARWRSIGSASRKKMRHAM